MQKIGVNQVGLCDAGDLFKASIPPGGSPAWPRSCQFFHHKTETVKIPVPTILATTRGLPMTGPCFRTAPGLRQIPETGPSHFAHASPHPKSKAGRIKMLIALIQRLIRGFVRGDNEPLARLL
jgi:hypothetical protein